MIDRLILFPYWLTLKCRHAFYNIGLFKSHKASVPTICVGNITVGGTGKTPHTEMIIRMLLESEEWGDKNIAVLSRGYKRSTKGFQQVTVDGTAEDFGDDGKILGTRGHNDANIGDHVEINRVLGLVNAHTFEGGRKIAGHATYGNNAEMDTRS